MKYERIVCLGSSGERTVIEIGDRVVGELIGLAVCKMMEKTGIRAAYALIGWQDWHILRCELRASWADDGPVMLATPVGMVKVIVDPAVEKGVRVLPEVGRHYHLISKPELTKAR